MIGGGFASETSGEAHGHPMARGLLVPFLLPRPLKWGFRMFFRSSFPTFRPQSPSTQNSEHPFIDITYVLAHENFKNAICL
jgi:hypothetical protein